MTPFVPEAQTTNSYFSSGAYVTLTPRRFVSIPVPWTCHHEASSDAAKTKAMTIRMRTCAL